MKLTNEKKQVNLLNYNLLDDKLQKSKFFDVITFCYIRILSQNETYRKIFTISIVFRYINFFALLFHQNFTFLWDVQFFVKFRTILNHMSIEYYLQNNKQAVNYILLVSSFFLLLIYVLGMIFQYLFQHLQHNFFGKYFRNYIKFLAFFNNAFGIAFYFIFLSNCFCVNEIYGSIHCYSGINLLRVIIGAIGMCLLIIITTLMIIFFSLNNPFVNSYFIGQRKIYFLIFEIEKFVYAIYFIIDKNTSIVFQFLILLLMICIIKLYFRRQKLIYYNQRNENMELILEGCYFYFVIMVNLLALVKDQQSSYQFINTIVVGFIFGKLYQMIFEYLNGNLIDKFYKSKKSIISKDLLRMLIKCINNQEDEYYQNKLNMYIIKHNNNCNDISCKCQELLYIQKQTKEKIRLTFIFLECQIEMYVEKNPKNVGGLFLLLNCQLFKSGGLYKVIDKLLYLNTIKMNFLEQYQFAFIKDRLVHDVQKTEFKKKITDELNFKAIIIFNFKSQQCFQKFEKIFLKISNLWESLVERQLQLQILYRKMFNISNQLLNLIEEVYVITNLYYDNEFLQNIYQILLVLGFFPLTFQKEIINKFQNKITKTQNVVFKYREIHYSLENKCLIMIISSKKEEIGIIKYSSSYSQEIIGYNNNELIDQNISLLMPNIYKEPHQKLIKNYFIKQGNKQQTKILIHIITKNQYMEQFFIYLKFYPLVLTQPHIIAIIKPFKNSNKIGTILFSKNGEIHGINKSTVKVVPQLPTILNNWDLKKSISIYDIFQKLEKAVEKIDSIQQKLLQYFHIQFNSDILESKINQFSLNELDQNESLNIKESILLKCQLMKADNLFDNTYIFKFIPNITNQSIRRNDSIDFDYDNSIQNDKKITKSIDKSSKERNSLKVINNQNKDFMRADLNKKLQEKELSRKQKNYLKIIYIFNIAFIISYLMIFLNANGFNYKVKNRFDYQYLYQNTITSIWKQVFYARRLYCYENFIPQDDNKIQVYINLMKINIDIIENHYEQLFQRQQTIVSSLKNQEVKVRIIINGQKIDKIQLTKDSFYQLLLNFTEVLENQSISDNQINFIVKNFIQYQSVQFEKDYIQVLNFYDSQRALIFRNHIIFSLIGSLFIFLALLVIYLLHKKMEEHKMKVIYCMYLLDRQDVDLLKDDIFQFYKSNLQKRVLHKNEQIYEFLENNSSYRNNQKLISATQEINEKNLQYLQTKQQFSTQSLKNIKKGFLFRGTKELINNNIFENPQNFFQQYKKKNYQLYNFFITNLWLFVILIGLVYGYLQFKADRGQIESFVKIVNHFYNIKILLSQLLCYTQEITYKLFDDEQWLYYNYSSIIEQTILDYYKILKEIDLRDNNILPNFYDYYLTNQYLDLTSEYKNEENFDISRIENSVKNGYMQSLFTFINLNQFLVIYLINMNPQINRKITIEIEKAANLLFVLDQETQEQQEQLMENFDSYIVVMRIRFLITHCSIFIFLIFFILTFLIPYQRQVKKRNYINKNIIGLIRDDIYTRNNQIQNYLESEEFRKILQN